MMIKALGLAALRAWVAGATVAAAQTRASYTISVPEYDKRLATIEARFKPASDTLLMNPDGADHLKDGWSTFVRSLAATDGAGRAVPLTYIGHSMWTLSRPVPDSLVLGYEVMIHHDQGRWPFGHDESAYAKGDCVFYTGSALFIGQLAFENVRVTFNIPADWQVATPWKPVAGMPNTYQVTGIEELINVGMLVGKQIERTVRSGDFELILAVGHDLAGAVDQFAKTIEPVVPAAVELFGGAPAARAVVIANRDTYDGGGTFIRSISMLFKDAPTAANRGTWGHIITHEILHLWNGHAIDFAGQEYWFSEGFTDYLADVIELRTGIIDERELFKRLATKYDEYMAVAGKISMKAGGDEKAEHYDLVYSGGLMAALALDVEIARKTKSAKSLADIMRQMYRDFGTTGKKYQGQDVAAVASTVAGTDLGGFFSRYVTGTEVIPIGEYLRVAGLEMRRVDSAGKPHTVIRRKPSATRAERALLAKILGSDHQP